MASWWSEPGGGGRVPVIGMLHVPALPGSPGFAGSGEALAEAVLGDAQAWVSQGVDGLMLENFGDIPFFKDTASAQTVAHMTVLASAVGRAYPQVPLGINVLRNDVLSALAIAEAVGGCYVRVNVLCGAVLADQGVIEGRAAQVMRQRAAMGAKNVAVWADVAVKHAAPLADRPLDEQVQELTQRAMADAVIVSGTGTGKPTLVDDLTQVKAAAGASPVLVGSGVTVENAAQMAQLADGLIVGSSVKYDSQTTAAVDPQRVRALMQALGR